MSTPFKPGKLRDFFKFYDDKDPQCVEAVKRLETSLQSKAPELLTDQAYWVQAWRKPEPKPVAPPKVLSVNLAYRVAILAQGNAISCGQTSCAMAVNTITGQKLTDYHWQARHGFNLLGGLQAECPEHTWEDVDRPRPEIWPRVMASLAAGCPAVCGVNGPDFSPSGHGHIVCIIGLNSKKVIFGDPNRGRLRELERERFEQAQEYPQGNFLFLATPR